MAIAFGAIGAKAGNGNTTTVAIAHPASVGAGDLLIAGRCVWQAVGIAADDETGWTPGGELRGGTGTAADNHATLAATDYREAAGGETGSVTFDQSGTIGGTTGVMARYTKDAGSTWDVASATGDDATHAADRSVTSSTSLTLEPGDVLVAVVAVDTDAALTITSPTFTASGITFGTATRRTSGSGVTTGNDGNIEIFDVDVSSGTGTAAVTLTFTTATSQCGPVSFLRLREAAGAANVTPDDAGHAHAAESPGITQVHEVPPADAAHTHAAETPSVAQVHVVAPAESTHGHAAESPTITIVVTVSPGDGSHGHAAATPSITQVHGVTPADGGHAHAADSPTVAQVHVVIPADATSGHAAETPALTQVHVVAANDATHGHSAESPSVTAEGDTAPTDGAHGHSAESPVVTQVHVITPDGVTSAHVAGQPALVQVHFVVPADAGHAHTAEMAVVDGGLDPAEPAPATRTITILAENRTFTIAIETRVHVVEAENRTLTAH